MSPRPDRSAVPAGSVRWRDYALALASVGGVAALGAPLLGHLDLANIVMLFPLAVLYAAIRLGRGPAVVAALVAVLLFDVFFVPPHFTLVVSDLQYLLTFGVLLAVALITAQLATGLRQQRDMAERREQHAQALYGMARDLSAALTVDEIARVAGRFAGGAFAARTVLFVPDEGGVLAAVQTSDACPTMAVPAPALRAFELDRLVEAPETPTDRSRAVYVPLKAPVQVRGVIGLLPLAPHMPITEGQGPLLDAFANLLAVALERVHYVTVAQRTEVQIASERLGNSLLAALSHDLRTPLTAIVGLADTLSMTPPELAAGQTELVGVIRDEALRTSALVNNLLDMARFEAGGVRLHRDWHSLEEIVGAALQARASLLARHALELDLPADLPLVDVDGVLVERVLCNLIENAAKHTPPGSRIEVRARALAEVVELRVCDSGPGLPDEMNAEDWFGGVRQTRGSGDGSRHGLGLAIVAAIVAAHGGSVAVGRRDGGGACFMVCLPRKEPPAMPPEFV